MRTRALLVPETVAAFLLGIFVVAPACLAQPAPPPAVSTADRAAIIERLGKGLDEIYVFPDVAKKMVALLRERLSAGAYDGHTDALAFCNALTEDLRSISHDKHLGVRWEPPPADTGGVKLTHEERQARFLARQKRDNFCFEKVEHLPGNVGYLKFNCFASADQAGETAIAAMRFLGNSDALIFDLRDNGGGSPSMIQLLSSYLFEEPKHLNSFYIRKSDTTKQFWTQAHVEGTKLPDVPVFVLTSPFTFSAAEEFTYNLKSMERGTIIGETTGGGAHPVEGYEIEGYPVVANIPFGRAVNPVTGTNWEGTGITPDIQVPAGEALTVAHQRAIGAITSRSTDEEHKAQLAWIGEALEAEQHPLALGADALAAYVGDYGPRRITLENGMLCYQREGRPKLRSVPMREDLFLVPEVASFRISFERDAAGKVVRLVGLYQGGFRDANERTAP